YDHCFMVDGAGFRRHARIDHPATGRRVEVWSDQPACQFYTGAFLPGTEGGGRTHDAFAALALEPQHVADAPNLPWAPSPVVRPGEPYRHHLEFRLTTDASEAS
ncbi:MAG: galactose-1-epimerase, partial [Actinomycetota bacterium]|nr:galactose-1-epimerase [Actinomycetota bacterium]